MLDRPLLAGETPSPAAGGATSTITEASPPGGLPAALAGPPPVDLPALQGTWFCDGVQKGAICYGRMRWWEHSSEQSPVSIVHGHVLLEVGGVPHIAQYFSGPPPTLRWGDGTVWKKGTVGPTMHQDATEWV